MPGTGNKRRQAPQQSGQIVDAARREVARNGLGSATSGRVARTAGVSKALVHYHFTDKVALLTAVGGECKRAIERRGASLGKGRPTENPIDAFGEWFEQEVAAEDLRVAIQLGYSENEEVRSVSAEGLGAFRKVTAAQIERVLDALDVELSLPVEIASRMASSTLEGMVASGFGAGDVRQSTIEALWLSLLSLAK